MKSTMWSGAITQDSGAQLGGVNSQKGSFFWIYFWW